MLTHELVKLCKSFQARYVETELAISNVHYPQICNSEEITTMFVYIFYFFPRLAI